jgi:hypothetical protein
MSAIRSAVLVLASAAMFAQTAPPAREAAPAAAPGGHAFNRLDTKLARESRTEVYRSLAQYLHPDHAK